MDTSRIADSILIQTPADASVAFASASRSNDNEDSESSNEEEAHINIGVIIKKFHDTEGSKHWVAQYGKTVSCKTGKKYTKARKCAKCGKHTCCFCYQCGVPLCYSINRNSHDHMCFKNHVREHVRKSVRLGDDDSELIE